MGASGRKILRPYKWVNSETAAYAQGGANGGHERGDEIPEELKYKKVLVVDDIYDSGVTLDLIRRHLPEADYYTLLVRGKNRDWTPLHSQCIESDEWITFWWENLKET